MIIENDRNFPLLILIIDRFKDMEAKTLKNILSYYNERASKENMYFYLHVDLFELEKYNLGALTDTISYFTETSLDWLNSVTIYVDKNKSSLLSRAMSYVNSFSNDNFKIKLIQLEKKKNW